MKADPLALEASTWPTRDVGPTCRICQVALELGHCYYDEEDPPGVVHYSCATKEEEERENVGGEGYTAWPSDDEVAFAVEKINAVLLAPINDEEKNVNQPAYPTAPPQGQAPPTHYPQQPPASQPVASAPQPAPTPPPADPQAGWVNPASPPAEQAPDSSDTKPKRKSATPPEKAAKLWKTVQKTIEEVPDGKLNEHHRAFLLNVSRGMEKLCLTFEKDCSRMPEKNTIWDEIADLGAPREGLGIF